MKTIQLTKSQDQRRSEIGGLLWKLHREKKDLQNELDEMGMTYDIVGNPTVNVKVVDEIDTNNTFDTIEDGYTKDMIEDVLNDNFDDGEVEAFHNNKV
jgi:hypothetical protein